MSHLHHNMLSDLSHWYDENEPWKSGFISLMRAVTAKYPDMPPVGTASRPRQEPYRLGQTPNMAFAPREIADISHDGNLCHIDLYSLGIWGPQGAMPVNFTEQAFIRLEHQDTLLRDFVNIFHHRALSLFYRNWFVSQDVATLDRKDDERFSFYIGALIGLVPDEICNSVLPTHARLSSASHLIREARNPEGLAGALEYYFGIRVELREFTKQWIFLETSDQTRMGDLNSSLLLSEGAILGNTVQDRQHKFSLVLGPLTLEQYMRFSLWGEDLPILKEWVRSFVGFEYAWDVQLVLAPYAVPKANLDGSHQLGYAAWLPREKQDEPISGMSFDPETHLN
ncbi:type VI secretion system baseplate subunit TssG [Morganella morganii]|uniref:type VI secretion system baseplate subunit TssG n=1 Tax=Morganella morganii TaxID=582 RepID=UPI001BD95944|nr:type VI secretion system baseplate subunit TssG [Morganella morganii]MBT0518405.1 type VI secretion system baseplate subunit TssG [Morganella morganii subsp. morganii]QWL90540.1 type VI secretion system baseplate subunit TssG [Morganella morganii subsp. morganii]